MIFNDLREFIKECEKQNDCKVVEGTDWNLELGLITELAVKRSDAPLLLFDNIKDYKKGYRVATKLFSTPRRTALTLQLPLEAKGVGLVKAWREKTRGGLS